MLYTTEASQPGPSSAISLPPGRRFMLVFDGDDFEITLQAGSSKQFYDIWREGRAVVVTGTGDRFVEVRGGLKYRMNVQSVNGTVGMEAKEI